MKKISSLILMVFLLNIFFLCEGFAAALPEITAKSAVVIEAKTGKILYAKDAESRRYPASTTKMMTLIVALEKGGLDDIVTASRNAAETEGSSIDLADGEKLKLKDLLYGMMLVSGNDATVAVAEHIAGSVPAFAKLMTQKAHEIGAENTNFVNSSGLPDERHYSTAHDLAKIAAYGYQNELFESIVSTKEKIIPSAEEAHGRDLHNENRMLWLYDGGNGVKTGYTEAAGRCLVAGAKRDGVQIITVVLDSAYMWNDSIALLDYGFSKVGREKIYSQGDVLAKASVRSGRSREVELILDSDIYAPVVNGEKTHYQTELEVPDKVAAKIEKGQKIGRVKILYEGKPIIVKDLIAAEAVEKKSFFANLVELIQKMIAAIAA